MAHKLNFHNGKTSFFSVREKPWHGLGQLVQEAQTSSEAIKLAQLDYEVVKEPIYLKDGIVVPDLFATVRQDTRKVFGTVGSRYEVLPNVDAFDFFDQIVGSKEAIFETAGAIGDGETIFITAKLPAYMEVKGDLIEQYLFLTNNHNGRGVVQAAFTPIRIVCNNTLNAALSNNSNRIKVMHTSNMKDRLYSADKLMGIINKMKLELESVFNAMAKKPIVDKQLKDLLLNTFATREQLDIIAGKEISEKEIKSISKLETILSDAYAYALTSDTQQTKSTKGTVFGAYNAVTGYIQNVKKVKDQERQLVSVMEGTGFDYTQTAFNLCKELL